LATNLAAEASSQPYERGDFTKFWIGQVISSLGDSFTGFALPLLVYQITGSAFDLAISSAVAYVPYLLFGLAIGAWVDRADRRRLMIAADIGRALLVASVPLLAGAGFFALWYVYAVQFVVATLGICFSAAQSAALPSLVERDGLVAANGRLIAGWSAAAVVGPLLAGGLAAFVPMPALLLVDALSFVVSALALGLIRRRFSQGTAHARARLREEIAAGLRYVWRNRVIRAITLLLLLLNIVGPTARVQLVLFAKQQLGASDARVGLLSAVASAGVLLGSLGASRLTRRWPSGRVALGSVMVQALLLILFAQQRLYWPALLIWGLLAGVGVLADVNIMALRQAATPDHLLGRVTTATRTIGFAAIPLSTLLGGALIDRLGRASASTGQAAALVYGAIGALTLVIGVSFWFSVLGRSEEEISG
jgi:MFS family permease